MLTFRTGILLFLAAVAGCSAPDGTREASAAEDRAAVERAGARLDSALASDDVPAIMAELTEDHVTIPPGEPAFSDSAALAAWHRARVERYSLESERTRQDLRLYGDIAVERWSAASRLVPRGAGEAVTDSIEGVWIWERAEDGSWELLWSIWNSSRGARDTAEAGSSPAGAREP